jgi:hypothetical protein
MRVVNSLDDARSALASGEQMLASPYAAACHAGVNYYRAMLHQLHAEFPEHPFTFLLCCGTDAAIAHDALRLGFASVRCDSGDAIFTELQLFAAACGATLQRA